MKKSRNQRKGALARQFRLNQSIARCELMESRVLLSFTPYVFDGRSAVPGYEFLDMKTAKAQTVKPLGATSPAGAPLTPATMRAAYGMGSVAFNGIQGDGTGQTIAIVDVGSDPDIATDLQTFDSYYNLPNPPSFQQLSQTGSSTNLPGVDPGWPGEISLDVEWSHVMAPGANIILFAASDLYAAVQEAASYPGVAVVSMSFTISGNAPDSDFITPAGHTGVSFFAGNGDSGSEVPSPAQSVNVVAVGGTSLFLNSSGGYSSESAWFAGGGGVSGSETQPAYQSGLVSAESTTQRTTPDVSMDADPGTGVAIVDSYDGGSAAPWLLIIGGTSLATPLLAGVVAVADQGRVAAGLTALDGGSQLLPRLYQLSKANYSFNYHDITTGNNGHPATVGYDLATGLGSVAGNNFVPDLAGADTISGRAFTDNAGTGVYTAADTVMANKTVYLDLNDSGAQTPTDPTTTTNAAGQYTFSDVIGSVNSVVRVVGTTGTLEESNAKFTTAYNTSQTYNLVFTATTPTFTATATPASTTSNSSLGVTVTGAAPAGLTYTWAAATQPTLAEPATFSVNGTAAAQNTIVSFGIAGTYVFGVNITDSAGQLSSATVTVVVTQALTTIVVTSPTSTTAGKTLQQTATGYDQYGNVLNTQPSFTWAVTAGGGTISSSGLYTAPSAGTLATVQASSGSVHGSGIVGVVNAPWQTTDIGSPALGGYAYDTPTTTTVAGTGTGISGTSDQFHFDYQPITGNATLFTEITTAPTITGAQAGLMFRASTTAGDADVDLVDTVGQGVVMAYRNVSGASAANIIAVAVPSGAVYLKLIENGSNYIGYYSTTGSTWTLVGSYSTPLGTSPLGGLAVSSDSSYTSASAVFTGTVISDPTVITAAAASPTIVTGLTTNLSVTGADATNPAGAAALSYTWSATSLPTGASSPTFSTNGTNTSNNVVATFSMAGNYTLTVSINDAQGQPVTSSVAVTVNQTFSSIAIEPVAANINAGSTETFAAVADDQFGNALPSQPTFTWSKKPGVGSITSAGVYTAPATSGSATTIQASSGAVTGTALVTVIGTVANPTPTVAVGATATPSPANLTTAGLSVLGADDAGESILTYTWAVTALPAGTTAPTFSINGTNAAKNTTATFSRAGSYTFTVTIVDTSGNSVTSAVSLAVSQTVTSITITPGTVNLLESNTQNFTATGYDQFGVILAAQPAFTWSETTGSIGVINAATGVYIAPDETGAATVLAASGNVTQTATITVAAPALVYQVTASGYNTGSGVLTDQVGGLTAIRQGTPTITANDTPSGKSAITFNGANAFALTAQTPRSQNETIFAVVKPSASMASLSNGGAIIGGSDNDNSPEYRLIENSARTGLVQEVLETGVNPLGYSTTIIPTTTFTIVEVVLNENTNVSNFYADGVLDSQSGQANNLAQGMSRVGARQTGNSGTTEYYIGDIAEVDVYNDALSASATATITAQLTAEYLTAANRVLTSIVVTPGAGNLREGATQTFSAVAYDQFGVPLASQPAFTWSNTGVGSIVSSTGLYTAPASTGTATIKVTSGSISQSVAVTVTHAVPVFTTAAAASPATVTAASTALSASATDNGGAPGLLYTWTATTIPAGASQPVFSVNGTSAANDTTATFYASGTYVFTVAATDTQGSGTAYSSVSVAVTPKLTSIVITPGTIALYQNTTESFTGTAEDQFGLPLASPPALTWSITAGVGSINSSTGIYTAPNSVGTATIQTAGGGITATANVTVSMAVPIVVTAASAAPSPVTGTTTALSVLAADAAGAGNLTYTWATAALPGRVSAPTFSINGTNAAKNTTVTFFSAGAYTFTVTITDSLGNLVSSSVSVAVSQKLTSIVVTPGSVTLDESSMQGFTAVGYDQFGTVLASQPAFTFSVTGSGSINSSTGVYTASTTTGTATVKAANGTVTQAAGVTISTPALVYKVTAADYNTASGILKDEVAGLTGTAVGSPTITANDTPSGASAITFNGSNVFNLASTGPYSQNQTIFAVIKPSPSMTSLADGGAIIGGAQGTTLEYRLIENSAGTGLVEQDVRTNTTNLGNGNNLVSTTGFSVVELVLDQDTNVSTFYDNGVVDPSTGAASNISVGASRIGARQNAGSGSTEFFIGDIAEVDIYNNALSSASSAAIESQLAAEYFTPAATRQLTSIVVTPGAVNLNESATQTFTAIAYDQYGAALSTQPTFTWSDTGVGSINSASGVYTAPAATGNSVVQVSSGAITQTATVTVGTAPANYSGTTGNDTYAIRLSPTNSTLEQIFVNTPESAAPTYTVPVSLVPGFSFTSASDGTLTVDFANGNPLPANGVSYAGGETLFIKGSPAGGLPFAVNATQITDTAAASSPITYSNVGTVEFDLTGGANTLTQQATASAALTYNAGAGSNVLNVNGGAFTFNRDPQLTSGNLTVNDSSAVVFSSAPGAGYAGRNLAALNLSAGATATVVASATATDRIVLEVGQLSIAGGATLDLGNNAMIIHNGNLGVISSLLDNGYSNGLWTGAGITSSTAASDPTHLTALGAILNANAGGGALMNLFDNQSVAASDVLLKYTYYGDTNLDGKVDGSDYSRIDNGYVQGLTGWANGDFNYDGSIDGSDYALIDNSFNTQGAQLAAEANSPRSLLAHSSKAKANQPAALYVPRIFSNGSPLGFAESENQDVEQLMLKKDLLDEL